MAHTGLCVVLCCVVLWCVVCLLEIGGLSPWWKPSEEQRLLPPWSFFLPTDPHTVALHITANTSTGKTMRNKELSLRLIAAPASPSSLQILDLEHLTSDCQRRREPNPDMQQVPSSFIAPFLFSLICQEDPFYCYDWLNNDVINR